MKVNEVQLGVAFGLAKVGTMIVMSLVGMMQGAPAPEVGALVSDSIPMFLNGAVLGYLLGFFYNRLTKGRK